MDSPWAYLGQGHHLNEEGNPHAALVPLLKCLEIARRQDASLEIADAVSWMGLSAFALGAYDKAAQMQAFAAKEVGEAGFAGRYSDNWYVEYAQDLRSRLGDRFDPAFTEGAAMTPEEAAALAASLAASLAEEQLPAGMAEA